MLLCRKIVHQATVNYRCISLTSWMLLDVPSSKPLNEQRQEELDESKKKLTWRLKPFEKKDAWYSKFKLFLQDDNEEVKETFITRLQQPIPVKPSSIKKMWTLNAEKQERFLQQFIPERHRILGNDLAAAHFLVYRKGRVRFYGEENWVKQNDYDEVPLPDRYVHGMFVEAIDCEGVELYYEGLENLRRLKSLRYLSFKNVKSFDDWCLDRVSGSEFESLEELNLSGTVVTQRGLQSLYRIPSLKKLILDDPYRDSEWSLTIAMLQEIIPDLQIEEINLIDVNAKEAKA